MNLRLKFHRICPQKSCLNTRDGKTVLVMVQSSKEWFEQVMQSRHISIFGLDGQIEFLKSKWDVLNLLSYLEILTQNMWGSKNKICSWQDSRTVCCISNIPVGCTLCYCQFAVTFCGFALHVISVLFLYHSLSKAGQWILSMTYMYVLMTRSPS